MKLLQGLCLYKILKFAEGSLIRTNLPAFRDFAKTDGKIRNVSDCRIITTTITGHTRHREDALRVPPLQTTCPGNTLSGRLLRSCGAALTRSATTPAPECAGGGFPPTSARVG